MLREPFWNIETQETFDCGVEILS